jgi:phosphate acetyltransferase
MAGNLYITAMEPESGKSVVAVGLAELLAGRVERLGFFRPIVPAEPDSQLELMRGRYQAEVASALTEEEAAALDDYAEVRKRVVEAYRALEDRCDFVLCEGTDFAGAAAALDFGLNADLANEVGAPVLVVVRGGSADETLAAVHAARGGLETKGCSVFGLVVNRAGPDLVADLTARLGDEPEPVYVVPERPELASATVGDIAEQLGAEVASGARDGLEREIRDVRVAAMSVEHFLEHLSDGTLVIVPGDRPDVLVACVAAAESAALPTVAGVVLTGGYPPAPNVRDLLETAPFPVLEVPLLTHEAAVAVQWARPALRAGSDRKVAAAIGAFEAAVDTGELAARFELERPRRVTPIMFEYELVERAKSARRRIVLPEGDDDRVLRAAEILLRRGVVDLTILGDPDDVRARAGTLGVDLGDADLVDPLQSPLRDDFAARYYELRKHKGATEEYALDRVADPSYFGTMMVLTGAADGMVSGAAHTTADTIRPAFEVIKARKGVSVVSSVFLMCLPDRVLVYGDCAVNPNPDAGQLADIAVSSAETAATFGVDPRVAMLSYSTGESGKGEDVDKVREATEAVRERRPDLPVEGPIQYDAAVDPDVARLKLPDSDVAGQATVFVFPDLESGNVAYKAVQRSANAVAIGPVLQGLHKPVNDLSRGCTIPDIVNTVAITAIQAQ